MEFQRHVCKKEVHSCKNYKIKLSQWKLPDTETSSKLFFEVNIRPVIQLVRMKKETKTRERRKNEKVTKQLMKIEMKLYLVAWLGKLRIDWFPE